MEVKSCLSRSRSLSHTHIFCDNFSFFLSFFVVRISKWGSWIQRHKNGLFGFWFEYFALFIDDSNMKVNISYQKATISILVVEQWTASETREEVTCIHMCTCCNSRHTCRKIFVETFAFSLSRSLSHPKAKQIQRFNQIEYDIGHLAVSAF